MLDWKKLKNETNGAAIKGIKNLFGLKKENKAIKVRIIWEIKKKILSMKKMIIINQ